MLENIWKWGEDDHRENFQLDRKDLEEERLSQENFHEWTLGPPAVQPDLS